MKWGSGPESSVISGEDTRAEVIVIAAILVALEILKWGIQHSVKVLVGFWRFVCVFMFCRPLWGLRTLGSLGLGLSLGLSLVTPVRLLAPFRPFTSLRLATEFALRFRLFGRSSGLGVCRGRRFRLLELLIVLRRDIAFLLGTFEFLLVCGEDALLEFLPADGIDGMGNVSVKFRAAPFIPGAAVPFESVAAFVAVICAEMVFATALGTFFSEFAAGHRDERP
jgi:hypothetical protein